MTDTALRRWADALAAWAIPDHVLARAPETPWVLPRHVFARRADAQLAEPVGATFTDAARLLGSGGAVLDVGAAAGASSLPLAAAGLATSLTAVDGDTELLAEYARRADRFAVPTRVVAGRWPDVAGEVAVADVVVCGNVLYNVADLEPFVAALTARARRGVVVETAQRHPLTELNPLWLRFHGIERPSGPTADDCAAALRELGVRPTVTRWRRAAEREHRDFAQLVDVTRRRLCLPVEATADVDRALRELGHDPDVPPDLGSSGRSLVTLTWAGTGA